jgi:hypothetical protein
LLKEVATSITKRAFARSIVNFSVGSTASNQFKVSEAPDSLIEETAKNNSNLTRIHGRVNYNSILFKFQPFTIAGDIQL